MRPQTAAALGSFVVALSLPSDILMSQQGARSWLTEFAVDRSTLGPAGRNRFFVLEPGHQAVYEGGGERLTITVLAATEVADAVKVLGGSYTGCVRTEETTPLEAGTKEYKRYCPGVGLVEDGDLRLVPLPGTKP